MLLLIAALSALPMEDFIGKYVGGYVKTNASRLFLNNKSFVSQIDIRRMIVPEVGILVLGAQIRFFIGEVMYTTHEPVSFPHSDVQNTYNLHFMIDRGSYAGRYNDTLFVDLRLAFETAEDILTVTLFVPNEGIEASLRTFRLPNTDISKKSQSAFEWFVAVAKMVLFCAFEVLATASVLLAWDSMEMNFDESSAYENFFFLCSFIAVDFYIAYSYFNFVYHWFTLSSTLIFILFLFYRFGLTIMKMNAVFTTDDDDDAEAFSFRM